MSYSRCCVPGCNKTEKSSKLHRFPSPYNDTKRFNIWLDSVGGSLFALDKRTIYGNRRVCRSHFEDFFHFGNKLTGNAIPTLNLPGNISKEHSESECNINIQESIKKDGFFYKKTISIKKQKEIDKLLSDVENIDHISQDNTLDKVAHILGSDCDNYKVDFDGDDVVNVVIDGRKEATEDLDTVPEQPPALLWSSKEEQTHDILDQPVLSPQITKSENIIAVSSKKGEPKSQVTVNELIKSMNAKNLAIAKYYDTKRKNEEELHILRKKKLELEILEKQSKILEPND